MKMLKQVLRGVFLLGVFIANVHAEIPRQSVPKIAFITAIYGTYEKACKPFASQTIPADFICFTNLDNLISNGWLVDQTPYHLTNPCLFDTPACINSIHKNKHTFNIAKYYKQNFQSIPRLQKYDVIVWLDGTIQITNPKTAAWVIDAIKTHPIITWEHSWRSGKLASEVADSHQPRYDSTFWFNQEQPRQDVDAQYAAYLKDGYNDVNYWLSIDPNRKHLGVWVTCFIAFDNHNENVTKFLNLWYEQTLRHTTQDQIGFPYTAQQLKITPYTLPDSVIHGDFNHNDFYIKLWHGNY